MEKKKCIIWLILLGLRGSIIWNEVLKIGRILINGDGDSGFKSR